MKQWATLFISLVGGPVFLVVFYASSFPGNQLRRRHLSILSDPRSVVEKTLDKTVSSNDYQLASEESFGFFYDVRTADWERMRSITRARYNHQPFANPNDVEINYYQQNWEPHFSCPFERRVGTFGGMGDGGKWVCDPHRIIEQHQWRQLVRKSNIAFDSRGGCLVYSIGSRGEFRFEQGIETLLGKGQCEIHIFDPGDYGNMIHDLNIEKVFYHKWRLISSKFEGSANDQDEEQYSFKTIVKMLGHIGRKIDILKIDCEGCEWHTYQDWMSMGAHISQILVEIHNNPKNMADDLFMALQGEGYVIFHKEVNTMALPYITNEGGLCVEYAFLKLHPSFAAPETHTGVINKISGLYSRGEWG